MSDKFGDRADGYDPLQRADLETRSFNTAWLKNGEQLTILQRTGFAMFSLVFLGMGLYLLRFSLLFIRAGDIVFSLIFSGATALCLLFGVLGLRNVLRFGSSKNAGHDRSN